MNYCIDCINIRPAKLDLAGIEDARCAKDDAGLVNPVTSISSSGIRPFCAVIRKNQDPGSCAWYSENPKQPTDARTAVSEATKGDVPPVKDKGP